MALSEEASNRLADVVELQPTKNSELQERWDMDSGSEVHQYLESELRDYYYRDEDSLVRATAEAVALVGGDADDADVPAVAISPLEARIVDVLPGPDARSESVVSVLHSLQDAFDDDPGADGVRRALQRLRRKGVVAVEYRSVPTFRLAADRDSLRLERTDAADRDGDRDEDVEPAVDA